MRYFMVSDKESGILGWTYEHNENKDYCDDTTIEVWNMLLPGSTPDIFKHEDLCEITEEDYYSVYHAEDADDMNEAANAIIKKYNLTGGYFE